MIVATAPVIVAILKSVVVAQMIVVTAPVQSQNVAIVQIIVGTAVQREFVAVAQMIVVTAPVIIVAHVHAILVTAAVTVMIVPHAHAILVTAATVKIVADCPI